MDGLWGIVESEGILLEYVSLNVPGKHLYGLYYYDSEIDRPTIILDESLETKPRLHRCILAEELGHHFTLMPSEAIKPHTSFSFSRSTSINRSELRALKWACNYLIPHMEFLQAIQRGYRQIRELADYFYVTEWMVHRKFEFLRSKPNGQVLIREVG